MLQVCHRCRQFYALQLLLRCAIYCAAPWPTGPVTSFIYVRQMMSLADLHNVILLSVYRVSFHHRLAAYCSGWTKIGQFPETQFQDGTDMSGIAPLNAHEFEFSHAAQTRGHPYKLYRRHSCNNVRSSYFAVRVISVWNSLPAVQQIDFTSFLSCS